MDRIVLIAYLYLILFGAAWCILIWILLLPALIYHFNHARDWSDFFLDCLAFLVSPLSVVVALILFIMYRLGRLAWEIIQGILVMALVVILIATAPIVALIERLNLKHGWLFKKWFEIGDIILRYRHRIFRKLGKLFFPAPKRRMIPRLEGIK
jgi:hypothetical protein